MRLKVSEIAEQVHGRVVGDGNAVIHGAAGLAEAGPGEMTFLRDARGPSVGEMFRRTQATATFVPHGFASQGRTVIEVDNPLAAFVRILSLIERENDVRPSGVHPAAVIDPTAKLGRDIRVGAHCVIEKDVVIDDGAYLMAQVYVGARSRIGQNTILYPQVVVRDGVVIGKNCILHPGVVIGADGYGFFFAEGRHNKIPHVGGVIIEDDVEIGANSCVDRAMTGATVVGKGTKIDNLVQVAHNVRIGPHCLLVAQVGIAGSTTLGAGVVLAGQVGVADHITIGDGARAGAQTGIGKDVEKGAAVFGTPARAVTEELKLHSLFRRLPELFKDVRKLKEIIGKHA